MSNAIKFGGWIALVVVLIVGGYQLSLEKSRARQAEQELEKVQALLAAREDELAHRHAEEQVALPAVPTPVSPDAPVTPPVEAGPPAPAPPAALAKEPAPAPQVDLEDRVAVAQLNMMAEMTYQSLFEELQLSPELRASLKDVIAAHMMKMQQETGAAMAAKNLTGKAFYARMDEMKGAMRDELAQFLNPEELTAWDEYEPVADQMLYVRLVDGQMNMLAPELTNENRLVASQIMAEELVREFDALGQSDDIYNMDSHNAAQARALNASLDRLAEELDEQQFGQVQGFVNQAIAMFDAMKGR